MNTIKSISNIEILNGINDLFVFFTFPIVINPDVLDPEDADMTQDLVLAATNDCLEKIEVETENEKEVCEALNAKADIIMLDNMSPRDVKKMVELINGKALTEASGNIVLENIKDYAETGVDYISVGALTHSFKVLDISLKNLKLV